MSLSLDKSEEGIDVYLREIYFTVQQGLLMDYRMTMPLNTSEEGIDEYLRDIYRTVQQDLLVGDKCFEETQPVIHNDNRGQMRPVKKEYNHQKIREQQACKYFEQGFCKFGSTCKYPHIRRKKVVEKNTKCLFFAKGTCQNGLTCKFEHC